MENNEIKTINDGVVSNSNGSMVAKLAVAALGVAAGIGAVMFLKKRKASQSIDAEVIEDNNEE